MDALFQRNKKALSKATTLDSDTSVFEGELPHDDQTTIQTEQTKPKSPSPKPPGSKGTSRSGSPLEAALAAARSRK